MEVQGVRDEVRGGGVMECDCPDTETLDDVIALVQRWSENDGSSDIDRDILLDLQKLLRPHYKEKKG